MTSAYLFSDINAVKEIEYEKGTGSTGNYRYTEWKASGIPCKVQ